MSCSSRRIAVAAAVLGLAAPAGALAAHPIKGSYFNGSVSHGAYLITTRHTIKTLQLFCRHTAYDNSGPKYEFREARYEIRDLVHVSDRGTFSFRGTADRFGPEGQPLGRWKVRLSGRFVTSKRVEMTRRAADCGGTRATATLER
jgi:hypothetical protein